VNDRQINRRGFLSTAAATALLAESAATSRARAGQAATAEGRARSAPGTDSMADSDIAKLIILDPAHFHAALVQKQMLAGLARRVSVYAPLGPDLLAYLKLIEQFNDRPDNPTSWELDIHSSPRSLEEMIAAHPGNVVVLAGRNRIKIGKIRASLEAGLNVLSDKPWIIRAEDFPALEAALALADRQGLVAYDMMTERHEISTILQRELVNDPEVFGKAIPAGDQQPGVFMESVHHILKTVAGIPNPRPPFFFDIHDQGEGLTDVGTHLVDLVSWTLQPNQAISYRDDIKLESAKRWPTTITAAQFRQITGAGTFTPELAPYVHGDRFDYYCNSELDYLIRGVQVRLEVLWNWESPAGVDFHHAIYRGTNASVEVRQTVKENYRPEVFVAPNDPARLSAVLRAVRGRVESLQQTYPGVEAESAGSEVHISIPDRYRVGHEAHFAQVVAEFLAYLKSPRSMPAWERPNMLAKYYVTTMGAQLAR
jgi:predicted dehydrogenase